ncbi:MAG: YceD family protein, partial [Actinomycetota bacterium]
DALTLALPLNPVCRASCKGLCAHCGADLNRGPCNCAAEETDPRWAPLAALRERLES